MNDVIFSHEMCCDAVIEPPAQEGLLAEVIGRQQYPRQDRCSLDRRAHPLEEIGE